MIIWAWHRRAQERTSTSHGVFVCFFRDAEMHEAFSAHLWINDYKNLINERWSYTY